MTFRKRLVSTAMLAEAAVAAASASSRPSLQARTSLAMRPIRGRLRPAVVGSSASCAPAAGVPLPMLPGLLAVAVLGAGGAVRCSTSGCPAASSGGQVALDFQCGLQDGERQTKMGMKGRK